MKQQTPTELEHMELKPNPPAQPSARSQNPPPPKSSKAWLWWIALALLAAGGWYYLKKSPQNSAATSAPDAKGAGKRGGSGATPVVAIKARQGNIGVFVTGLGSVTPLNTVIVKSRVDGQLMAVHYNEGDLVHQDDLLIEIDPRP